MKKSDLALLILIVSVIALVVYFAGNAFFSQSAKTPEKAETVSEIHKDTSDPSARVFNADAVNPTVPITIGNPSQNP